MKTRTILWLQESVISAPRKPYLVDPYGISMAETGNAKPRREIACLNQMFIRKEYLSKDDGKGLMFAPNACGQRLNTSSKEALVTQPLLATR